MKPNFLVEGRPTLTVMVQARTPERTIELIRRGLAGGADAFGVQVDQLDRQYHHEETLREIFSAMEGKPAYVTCYRYTSNEGLTDDELAAKMLLIARSGGALIDVVGDLFDPSACEIADSPDADIKQKELIWQIHALGAEVLVSSHTRCYRTPEQVLDIARRQAARGADISKIVITAEDEQQLIDAFRANLLLREQLTIPSLFLCGGAMCQSHRRIAPLLQNSMFLCVVEHDQLATPAQPLLSQARRIIEAVHL